METGRIIGYLLDTIQASSISGTDSNGTITSYFLTSLGVHPESNNHVHMCNLNMLSLSLKKERNGKVLLKIGIIEIDNKMIIYELTKYFYIAARYFYFTN